MNSFARENGASLTDYFRAAVKSRREVLCGTSGTVEEWAANKAMQLKIQQLGPVLEQSNQVLFGIHASAFVYDNVVVKTNAFGQYCYDGQRQWLEWSLDNQSNPLAPKIALLLTDPETDRYLVVMERLVCHSGFIQHEYRLEIDEIFRASFASELCPQSWSDLQAVENNSVMAIQELKEDIRLMDEIDDPETKADLSISLIEHETAIEYIKQIRTFWGSLATTHSDNYSRVRLFWSTLVEDQRVIDVHSLNWMLRHNGEHVFLDPVN